MIFLTKKNKQDYLAYVNLVEACKLYNRLIRKYFSQEGRLIKVPNKDNIPKEMSLIKYLISVTEWKQIVKLQVFLDEKNISLFDYLRILISNWHNIQNLINLNLNIPIARFILSTKVFNIYQMYKQTEIRKLKYLKKKGIKEAGEMYKLVSSVYEVDVSNLKKIKKNNPELNNKKIVMIFQGEFTKFFRNYFLNSSSGNESEDHKIKSCLSKHKIDIDN